MNSGINTQFTRRRVKSENLCSASNAVKYPITESRKHFQETFNTYDEHKLLQNMDHNFFVNINSEESDCNSNSVLEYVTNSIDQGTVESSTSKTLNISRDLNTFSFSGNKINIRCCLHLKGKVENEREFGFIVTSNRFYKTRYDFQSFTSKHISNHKEVLISDGVNNPFYSFNSSSSISAGTSPPHNMELEMNYCPTFSFPVVKKGNNLQQVQFNENIFIYLTMRIFDRNGCWKYFPVHVVQFFTSMFFNDDDENLLSRNFHKSGIISLKDLKRDFPLHILRYPNMQNGEFVVSENSLNGQVRIESFPRDLMDLTKEEFLIKCRALLKM